MSKNSRRKRQVGQLRMRNKTEEAVKFLTELTDEEIREVSRYIRQKLPRHPLESKWNIRWELILDAIARSQDITQRGIRGIIAESVFESDVLPTLTGWTQVPVIGDLPFDFKIESRSSANSDITIQVKLQRTLKGLPLKASAAKKYFPDNFFVVEVQKTRNGQRNRTKTVESEVEGETDALDNILESSSVADETEQRDDSGTTANKAKTRPYRFGEFDIIAVNMQPSTNDWSKFMYTVGDWLIPRRGIANKGMIEILQPVSPMPSEFWTDELSICVEWVLAKNTKSIFNVEVAVATHEERKKALRAEVIAERAIKRAQEISAKRAQREKERSAKKALKAKGKLGIGG
jgi:hypothetical protein